MYDGRTLHGREVFYRVVEAFGDEVSTPSSRAPSGSRRPRWPASRSPPGRPTPGAVAYRSSPARLIAARRPLGRLLDRGRHRCRSSRSARRAPGSFRVRLDNFEGPFDLLLSLISRRQLDVTEVALSQVTDEFIAYLRRAARTADLGQATEFLVVAATLLDLKAARLLPAAEVEDEEDLALLEARDLLFARLLQYRAYKLAAALPRRARAAGPRGTAAVVELEHRGSPALLPEVLIGVAPAAVRRAGGWRAGAAAGAASSRSTTCTRRRSASREQMAILRPRLRRLRLGDLPRLVADCASTLEVVARFLGAAGAVPRGGRSPSTRPPRSPSCGCAGPGRRRAATTRSRRTCEDYRRASTATSRPDAGG